MTRFDETWHQLLDWTQGPAPSQRLAALLLNEEGYDVIDPSHPLGGKDKGADATCSKRIIVATRSSWNHRPSAGSTNPKRQSVHQGERVADGLVGQTRVRRIESTERVAP